MGLLGGCCFMLVAVCATMVPVVHRRMQVYEPNDQLRRAREGTPSPHLPGECLSRQDLADLINGWIYQDTGETVELDANYIGKLERGVIRWPRKACRDALHAILGTHTDAQLGFRGRRRPRATPTTSAAQGPPAAKGQQQTRTQVPSGGRPSLPMPTQPVQPEARRQEASSPSTDSILQRRVLLQQALSALAVGTVPALDVIRRGLAASMAPSHAESDVDDWEGVAQEYEHAYYIQAPGNLVLHLAADLADLQEVFARTGSGVHRGLLRVSGQLTAMMAMSLVNLGQFQSARRWWRTARQAADASGDASVRVWVRGQEVAHALYEQRPLSMALCRADEAIAISGQSVYAGTAETLGARAQLLALQGRSSEAREAVHALTDAFSSLPTQVAQTHTIMSGWPQRRLWHTASYVHTHLGNDRDAEWAQERALALIPDTAPRSRTQIKLHTAWRLVRAGDVNHGIRYARQAIEALPPHQRTALVIGVAKRALAAAPEQKRSGSEIARLQELLTFPHYPGSTR